MSFDEQRKLGEDGVRQFVTRNVIVVYLFMITIVLGGYIFFPAQRLPLDALAGAVDLVLKAGLPVVTLVLGHYFGSATKS